MVPVYPAAPSAARSTKIASPLRAYVDCPAEIRQALRKAGAAEVA